MSGHFQWASRHRIFPGFPNLLSNFGEAGFGVLIII
jgi:hypothetical protein